MSAALGSPGSRRKDPLGRVVRGQRAGGGGEDEDILLPHAVQHLHQDDDGPQKGGDVRRPVGAVRHKNPVLHAHARRKQSPRGGVFNGDGEIWIRGLCHETPYDEKRPPETSLATGDSKQPRKKLRDGL